MSNFFYIKNGALVPAGSATTPTLSTIGDEDTGLYFSAANVLSIATDGSQRFDFANTGLLSANSSGSMLAVSAASATVPSLIPNRASTTTGIGANASGNLSLIATATEVARITSTDMTMMSSARLFLAADPSDDLEASTKRYVDDSVASAVTGGAAGAGLTFSLGALNVGTASSGRIVVNADNIDLATIGTAGTYQSVTVDAYGRVSAGLSITNLTSATAATSDEIAVASAANSFAVRKVTLSSLLSAISAVSTSRTISTTAPLAGGGDLSTNRTLTFSITSLANTALSSSDELVAADASASFAPVKRTIGNLITDLSIWTATNDGASSGLDADLLDGQHGSYYAIGSRNISTTLPIAGGGDLSADRTLSLNITGLADTAITSVDEIVVADASASFAPIKRTIGNALTDLNVIYGLTPTDNGVIIGNGSAFVVETGATLKTSLSLTVGTDIQAYSANLTTWSGLAPSANGQSLVTAADYSAMRTLLGLVIGTNVQAYDADLTTWAGLTPSANAQSLVTAADYSAMRTLLGLVIGTNVQAYDADLTTWAGLTPSANAQSLVTAADYSAMRTLLGLGTAALQNTGTSGANVPLLNGANTWSASQIVTSSDSFALPMQFISTNADANAGPYLYLYRNSASPAANDLISTVSFRGNDSALNPTAYAEIYLQILDPTDGAESAVLRFSRFTSGTNSDAMQIAAGLKVGSPTGGDQGVGTLNAVTLYENGTSLASKYQGLDSELTAIAGLTSAADRLPYFTGSGTAALATFTTAGRNLIDDTDTTAQRTTLGLGTAATQNTGTSGANIPFLNGANTWSADQIDTNAQGWKLATGAGSSTAPILFPNRTYNAGISSVNAAPNGADIYVIAASAVSNTATSVAKFGALAITNYVNVTDTTSGGYYLKTGAASATVPTLIPLNTHTDTGIGSAGADTVSIIGFSTEIARYTTSAITHYASVSDTNASGYRLVTGATSGTVPTLVPNKTYATTGIGSSTANTISLIVSGTETVKVEAGALHIASGGAPTAPSSVHIDAAAGSVRNLGFYSAGNKRWTFGADNTSESGSEVGSDLLIQAYDDSGTLLQTSYRFIRSLAGTMEMGVPIIASSSSGAQISASAASGTSPSLIPNRGASTTGIGAQASGNVSLIAAGTEAVRVTSTDVSIRGSVTMTLAVDPSSALHAVTKQYVDNRKESIWVPGAGMISRTTNGAAAGTAETTTNKVMIKTLDFDASTIEYAQFQVNMPKSWNEGTMTAVFVWSHASTTTNFGVVWGIQGLAISDDDALDTAFGTAVTVTDTGGTTNDIYRTSETSAFTIGNSPAENDVVTFQVYRNATDGSDTMAIDARLHGVMLFYTTNAVTDA